MQLDTRNFGKIEIAEEGIIEFSDGIPGFESIKRFVVLGDENEQHPFKWLQSVDDSKLAFVVVNPFEVVEDYDIDIEDDILQRLGIEKDEDILIFSVVVIPEDISKMSMNLKAPIIINKKLKKGIQVVLDTDKYSVRHYILEELQGQEVSDSVGSNKEER